MEPPTLFYLVAGACFLPWILVPVWVLVNYRRDLKARKKRERLYK